MAENRSLLRARSAMPRPTSSFNRPMSSARPRRPYSAYTKRGVEEEGQKYDEPNSNREWWRSYVKDTPTPGSYKIDDFVEKLRTKHTTYGFRNVGRRPSSASRMFSSSGEVLLPGAYTSKDFLDLSAKRPMAYSFNAIDRDGGPKIGHGYGDKELDTNPMKYDLRAVETAKVAKEANTKDFNFKSKVHRFPSPAFPIVRLEGPAPGQYDPVSTKPAPSAMSSAFRSKSARFERRGMKVPGPGAYNTSVSDFGEPKPLPAAVRHMQKKHGISVT